MAKTARKSPSKKPSVPLGKKKPKPAAKTNKATAHELKPTAEALVSLCRQAKFLEAIDNYYAPNIVSIEAADMPGMQREMRGLKAVRGKSAWWVENNTVNAFDVAGPFYHGDDQFAVLFKMDVTPKATGQRIAMEEIAVYTVKRGKIVHERFYYAT